MEVKSTQELWGQCECITGGGGGGVRRCINSTNRRRSSLNTNKQYAECCKKSLGAKNLTVTTGLFFQIKFAKLIQYLATKKLITNLPLQQQNRAVVRMIK